MAVQATMYYGDKAYSYPTELSHAIRTIVARLVASGEPQWLRMPTTANPLNPDFKIVYLLITPGVPIRFEHVVRDPAQAEAELGTFIKELGEALSDGVAEDH